MKIEGLNSPYTKDEGGWRGYSENQTGTYCSKLGFMMRVPTPCPSIVIGLTDGDEGLPLDKFYDGPPSPS